MIASSKQGFNRLWLNALACKKKKNLQKGGVEKDTRLGRLRQTWMASMKRCKRGSLHHRIVGPLIMKLILTWVHLTMFIWSK